jgi:hypothetical protein
MHRKVQGISMDRIVFLMGAVLIVLYFLTIDNGRVTTRDGYKNALPLMNAKLLVKAHHSTAAA